MVCEDSPSEIASSSELLEIESPNSSAESNFRELDDAFLQTQTRIWLGEVLRIRLDEHIMISELLADGELLFQVSKMVWKLLLAKHMELRHIKTFNDQPFASKKSNERYRPYSNVDSFLKICKILGLIGVDLFSPSDVVERKNTRRVCMCIRSFSKKARSMNINVPDFDIVTCKVKVAMPKDLVGCIRRHIEASHSIILSDPSSYDLQKSTQGYSVTNSTCDYETYSDQSDDTEIKHALQFDGLHTDDDLYDYTSEVNYNIPSPEVANVHMTEGLYQLDIQDQQQNQISNDGTELLCSMESLQCHCSENTEHDGNKLLRDNAFVIGTPMKDPDLFHEEGSILNVHQSASSQGSSSTPRTVGNDRWFEIGDNMHELLRDNASIIRTPVNDKTPVIRDVSLNAKDRKDTDLFHEENSIQNVHQSASSHCSVENDKCFEIVDSIEVLRVPGMSCLSSEARNLRNQFDAQNNFQAIESFKFNDKDDQWDTVKEENESQDIMECNAMSYGIASNESNLYFAKELEETEHSLYSPDCNFCKTNSSDKAESHSDDTNSTLLKKFPAYIDGKSHVELKCFNNTSFCKWDQKGKCAMTSSRVIDINNSSSFMEDGSHEETRSCKQNTSKVLMSKVLLSCVSEEDVVSETIVKLDSDAQELENDHQDLASNTLGVDDCKKCPTVGDDANDLCGEVATTQDTGEESEGVVDMITNEVVVPTNYEDVSHNGIFITNPNSILKCNDCHQECEDYLDPVYHSEHTCQKGIQEEITPEDGSVHSSENIAETEGDRDLPKVKLQKKLLLKSVLGGAAAVGFVFMFLHRRTHQKNSGEKDTQRNKASSHKGKENIQKYSPQKVDKSSATEGVYLGEKLKLK